MNDRSTAATSGTGNVRPSTRETTDRLAWRASWRLARMIVRRGPDDVAVPSSAGEAVATGIAILRALPKADRLEARLRVGRFLRATPAVAAARPEEDPDAADRAIEARQRTRDARMFARRDELVAEHRASGAANDHGRALAVLAEARALVASLVPGDEAAMIDAHARLWAALAILPESARLGVTGRSSWRARASTLRSRARHARGSVPRLSDVRPRRATPQAVLVALARASFARVLEAPVAFATIDGAELLIRQGVDQEAREADLSWGIAAKAMGEAHQLDAAHASHGVNVDATARLAAHIREIARQAAEDLSRSSRSPRGGTWWPSSSGPSHRHEPRTRPSWSPRRSSAPKAFS